MDIKTAAAALNGNQYREEGSKDLFSSMKEVGLVAVFGASDDLMEFRGAIYDEVGAYDGGTAYVTSDGLLSPACEDDDCPHEAKRRKTASQIIAEWCPDDLNTSWRMKTDLPHEAFDIMEDEDLYCRGLVFCLADAADV